MSHFSNGILGTLAAAITLGAIQFASGNDLANGARNDIAQRAIEDRAGGIELGGQSSVNRSAKADRFAGGARASGQDKTLSFQVDQMPNTLVLIRISTATRVETVGAAGRGSKAVSARKSTLACEPVVSILTDVAKVLEPGRCLT